MIITKNKAVEIKVNGIEEMLSDVSSVITAFVNFSIKSEVPDEVIEKTLVGMIAEAFENYNNGNLIDLSGMSDDKDYD